MQDSDTSYLIDMAVRLMEIRRLLKPTGSIYLHCDPTMSHDLKLMMDAVFGRKILETKSFGLTGLVAPQKHVLPANIMCCSIMLDIPHKNRCAPCNASSKPPAIQATRCWIPFCGCATACIAAQIEGRQWAGIDISPKATELVQQRMGDELNLFFQGAIRTDIPSRTDPGPLPRYNCPENRKALYAQPEGDCTGCSTHFEGRNLEVDHISARRNGGTDHISNL